MRFVQSAAQEKTDRADGFRWALQCGFIADREDRHFTGHGLDDAPHLGGSSNGPFTGRLMLHDFFETRQRGGGASSDSPAAYSNKATLAVNPWMKFLRPIGPNSPCANKPANGIGPTFSWMVLAS